MNNKTLLNFNDDFLISSFYTDSHIFPNDLFLNWVSEKNSDNRVSINEIPLKSLNRWGIEDCTGNIRHDTNCFFSIEGLKVETNYGDVPNWDQPIINQPEIGILGIIAKKIDGVLHFLMQAKIEPGNINKVQISPTLQATKSNYRQVHGGNSPKYLEYFTAGDKGQVVVDQLQSEQGARFLKKRNRNIIIIIDEDIDLLENFCWLTLGQIKHLLQFDNLINMNTRTVISCIQYGPFNSKLVSNYKNLLSSQKNEDFLSPLLSRGSSLHSLDEIIFWITKLKSKYELDIRLIPLNEVKRWISDETSVRHESNVHFQVIGVSVEIYGREVSKWSQPIVKPTQEGLIAFIIKKIDNVYHFLTQAKLEPGNFDIVELAPTVQCVTGSYPSNNSQVPYLSTILNAPPKNILYSTLLSEEGGRFYREQNRNMIIEVEDDFPIEVYENYAWITLNQLQSFIRFNNYVNIAARSLLSTLKFN